MIPYHSQEYPEMTLKNRFLNDLIGNGLFPEQATAVIEYYLNSELGKTMKERMNDDESDYTEATLAAIWMSVRATAVQWIDKNIPLHWARPMFAD